MSQKGKQQPFDAASTLCFAREIVTLAPDQERAGRIIQLLE